MLTPDVIDRVKKADPDRYRAAMFADKDVRESLLVFYAFHSELAKIPELVSEPMLGAIRYQWWRDCVDEIYTEKPVRRHEVATPLAKVLRTSDVPRFWVDALINGRERDIDPRPFEDMSAAKQYCQDTSGQLMQIALNLTGEESGHVMLLGQAWGLTGLARGYRFYHDTMLKAVSFSDISQAAREDYDIVRSAITKMSTKAMPALGYGALIPSFLKRLESLPDPKNTPLVFGPLAKQTKLLKVAMTGSLPK